jgi:hypothetical protein
MIGQALGGEFHCGARRQRSVTEWHIEGEWFKNCNCDPGCPCDFNQRPTYGHCAGMVAMRIAKGHFGETDMAGVKWGAIVRWPGALHEGNGEVQPFIDSSASPEQMNAIGEIASGKHGDTFMEVFSFICPTVHEPVIAPVDFEFDIENRSGLVRVGDALEAEVDTLRGIDPPDPYRVLVRIPGGMEYTGPNDEAETALAKRISVRGPIEYEVKDGHSSMAYVHHGNDLETHEYRPTTVEQAFG